MSKFNIPDIVQVVPHVDYKVSVYFVDGKIVNYDLNPKLNSGIFKRLQDIDLFMNRCKIMNDTLAWDLSGNNDPSECIDIDPVNLYELEAIDDMKDAG